MVAEPWIARHGQDLQGGDVIGMRGNRELTWVYAGLEAVHLVQRHVVMLKARGGRGHESNDWGSGKMRGSHEQLRKNVHLQVACGDRD